MPLPPSRIGLETFYTYNYVTLNTAPDPDTLTFEVGNELSDSAGIETQNHEPDGMPVDDFFQMTIQFGPEAIPGLCNMEFYFFNREYYFGEADNMWSYVTIDFYGGPSFLNNAPAGGPWGKPYHIQCGYRIPGIYSYPPGYILAEMVYEEPYDPEDQVYLRIEYSGGYMHWQKSTDGESFTTMHSVDWSDKGAVNFVDLDIFWGANYSNYEADPPSDSYDNNIEVLYLHYTNGGVLAPRLMSQP